MANQRIRWPGLRTNRPAMKAKQYNLRLWHDGVAPSASCQNQPPYVINLPIDRWSIALVDSAGARIRST